MFKFLNTMITTAPVIGAAFDKCTTNTACDDVDYLGMWLLSVDQHRTRGLHLLTKLGEPLDLIPDWWQPLSGAMELEFSALKHLTVPLILIPCSLSNAIVVSFRT